MLNMLHTESGVLSFSTYAMMALIKPLTSHIAVMNKRTGSARFADAGFIIATESENNIPITAVAIRITVTAGPQKVQPPKRLPIPELSAKKDHESVAMKA